VFRPGADMGIEPGGSPAARVAPVSPSGGIVRKTLVLSACLFGLWSSAAGAAKAGPPELPLGIGTDGRHFVDRTGRPVLIQGDSAWSLIGQLSLRETEVYLDRRAAQGFNAVLVNLIEKKFSKNPPRNAAGVGPFLEPGNLSTPNEAYFAHADAAVGLAERKGMLVFLVPAYLGWKGGEEGWFREIRRNGESALRAYGRFVGRRLGGHPNIVWVVGGDDTPAQSDRWTVDALAEGIRESGARQLMTAHCGQESPAEAFGQRPWLDFNNIYSYGPDLDRVALREFQRTPPKPFILLEGFYEGEHDASPETIRGQAYTALLAGAAGHFFGNNPVWNFDSPAKVFPSGQGWIEALGSRGAHDMGILGKLFQGLRWADLAPDLSRRFLDPRRDGADRARNPIAAATSDGSLIVVYAAGPGRAVVRLNLDGVAPAGRAHWFDPESGESVGIEPAALAGRGQRRVTAPVKKTGKGGDWLLILQADRN
jgi:hypothetical protein